MKEYDEIRALVFLCLGDNDLLDTKDRGYKASARRIRKNMLGIQKRAKAVRAKALQISKT